MNNSFKSILIILASATLLLGIAAFAYRTDIWNYLSLEAEITDNNYASQTVKITDSIDVDILQSETMKSLEKQVNDFDYNNVCAWPGVMVPTADGFVNRSAKSCSVGTRAPFLFGKK